MRLSPVLLIASLCAGPALAQAGPPPHEVSPLTVTPRADAPRLTASYPAAGAAVAPGLLVLTLTFDQKMSPTGFDVGPGPGGEAPECLKVPRLLDNGKTFALLCRTLPGKHYAVALNGGHKGGFGNIGGAAAEPASVAFSTTSDEPVRFLEDAMKAAHLGDEDVPVQTMPGLKPPVG